jgi:hypothetical protein
MQVDSEDYLQDVVFNYYGNKMAVCSSDRKIKIYEKSLKEDKWEPVASWEVRFFIILGTRCTCVESTMGSSGIRSYPCLLRI